MTLEHSIVFECRHCHARLGASEEVAGKEVSCPKCKKPIVVPKATADAKARKA